MKDMVGPAWLAACFGGLALACTVVCGIRLVQARRGHRRADVPLETCHGLMGIAMFGMLIPATRVTGTGVLAWAWLAVWIGFTGWFGYQAVRDRRQNARGVLTHRGAHVVLAAAMVYMLAVTVHEAHAPAMSHAMSGMSGMPDMPGMSGGVGPPLVTLDLALAVALAAYAVLLLDRVGAGPLHVSGESRAATAVSPVDASVHIVMTVVMAYMLVMMLA